MSISNTDDIIDSRDVIARIEELTGERDSHNEDMEGEENGESWESVFPEDAQELAELTALQDEAEGYAADWLHGEVLIRDSYFKTYAQELADDIGAVPRDIAWPCSCIDWDQAARELRMDYSAVEFGGVTYWVR